MNEKIEDKFREITYESVANLIESFKEKLNDVYPSEKYHDVWLATLFDGIVDMVNIVLGELYRDDEKEITEMFEQLKTEFKSKYSKPRQAVLMSLLTILAAYDDDTFDILKLKDGESVERKTFDVAYM